MSVNEQVPLLFSTSFLFVEQVSNQEKSHLFETTHRISTHLTSHFKQNDIFSEFLLGS